MPDSEKFTEQATMEGVLFFMLTQIGNLWFEWGELRFSWKTTLRPSVDELRKIRGDALETAFAAPIERSCDEQVWL